MSMMMVQPYRFGSGGATYSGSLVRKSAGQVVGTSEVALTFDTELYDQTGWHDTVTNNSRMTVPSGVSLVRVSSNILSSNNNVHFTHKKGGVDFRGMGWSRGGGAANNLINLNSAPATCSTSDYFETRFVTGGSATITNDEETWLSIEALDAATRYAVVYHSTSQALSAGVDKTLAWDSEGADTSGFHDTVTNNSRLTVPSGITLVRLAGNIGVGNVTGGMQLTILKGGSTARGLPSREVDSTTEESTNVISAPIEVTAGDYFEFRANHATATSVPSSLACWFSIEEVPTTYQRALVYKGSSQSVSATTSTALTWDNEVYDTAAIHDNATNNTRLTVPSGCTKARPCFSVKSTGTASGRVECRATKNGADYFGQPAVSTDTAGTDCISGMGAWVDVTPGDYFEAVLFSSAATAVSTDNESWFCLECR